MKPTWTCSCLLVAMLAMGTAQAAVSRQQYDALILEARAGKYDAALEMLRQYTRDHPRDLRAAYDHILIASWAGKPAEAITAYESIQPPRGRMPANVLGALARAYRDTQQWDEALAYYSEGRVRFPNDPDFAVGEVMTLADANRADSALKRATEIMTEWPRDADVRLAAAYALKAGDASYGVLQYTTQAYTLAPDNEYVARAYILALQQARLPEAALRAAHKHPGAINAAELRRLEADYAAELARLAALPGRAEQERYAVADRALANYERLISAWTPLGEPTRAELERVRVDRLHALHARDRMSEVVQDYEAMLQEGVIVPDYAMSDVAAAYLYLREPEKAAKIYQRLNDEQAARGDDAAIRLANQIGLYYSLIESERFDEARAVIEEARAAQEKWHTIKGQPERIPNDLSLYVEHTAALGSYYAGDTAAAENRLRELVDRAPNNTNLHTALATVYLGREQPRRAEIELKLAETMTPRAISVETAQAWTALELQEWRQAELLLEDVIARYPQDLNVQHLNRDWAVHNKNELRISGYRGITSDSPVSGSGDFGIETVLYSAPLNYNWRVFGGGGYASGDFEEGTARHRYLKAGVEWRGRDLTAEAEVSTHHYGDGTKPGMRVSAAYDLSDHWQVGAIGEFRSSRTPLRALLNGVYSNSVTVFGRWRANEERQWSASLTPSRFSDGNNRLSLEVVGTERLYTTPRFWADLRFEVAASRNTLDPNEASYFNPESDLFILPTINLTQILYRRYDTVLEHRFSAGAGLYAQEGHGSGAVGVVGYGMRYRWNKALDVGATITGISRPYDGDRERELRIMFDMNIRF